MLVRRLVNFVYVYVASGDFKNPSKKDTLGRNLLHLSLFQSIRTEYISNRGKFVFMMMGIFSYI